jgi:hypothetical protein
MELYSSGRLHGMVLNTAQGPLYFLPGVYPFLISFELKKQIFMKPGLNFIKPDVTPRLYLSSPVNLCWPSPAQSFLVSGPVGNHGLIFVLCRLSRVLK